MSTKKSRKRRGRSSGFDAAVFLRQYGKFIVGGIVFIILLITITLMVQSCSVSHKSSTSVVKALIKAYGEGKESKVKECYGQKENPSEQFLEEMNAMMAYFKAHDPKSVKIVNCEALTDNANGSYVCIVYNMVLSDDQEYPCIASFMTKKREDKGYFVLPAYEITSEMSKEAAQAYKNYMTSEAYAVYVRAYNAFIKKNPGYEEKISEKLA